VKIKFSPDEVLSLRNFCEKLVFWDKRTFLRIQIKGNNIGIFGSTPFNCLAFIALPLQEEYAEADLVVSCSDILNQITDDKNFEIKLLDSNKVAPELALLPPQGPWMPGEKGIAGDVFPLVKQRLNKLKSQVDPLQMLQSEKNKNSITEDAWNENLWGGITFGALNVAAGLGMLSFPNSRINAATCQGWKRFVTPSGQVFIRPLKAVRNLLSVVK